MRIRYELEDKDFQVKISESKKIIAHCEFVDDIGSVYLVLQNGKHIALSAKQIEILIGKGALKEK